MSLVRYSSLSLADDICRHMERALQQTRSELVVMAESHEKLAGEFKHKDQQLAEFAARRESSRKLVRLHSINSNWSLTFIDDSNRRPSKRPGRTRARKSPLCTRPRPSTRPKLSVSIH